MQEGQIVRNKRTGEMGRVVNGQVVPINGPAPVTIGSPNPIKAAEEGRAQNKEARDQRGEYYERDDRSFDEAKKYRDEFRGLPVVENYNIALGTFNAAMNTRDTPEGDQSLITAFARMMDPNSVVREGEFATAAGNESTFKRIKAQIAKEFGVEGAGRLTPTGRIRLREEMRNLVVNRFKMPYDQARQQYSQFARMDGLDPFKVVGEPAEQAFGPEFVAQLDTAPEENLNIASGNTQAQKIPPEYQQEHFRYLQENWGKIDPAAYAEFRTGLDQKYNLTPNPQAYQSAVAGFNELASAGGSPAQLGAVPSPESPLGGVDQFITEKAQTGLGTGALNAANASMMGLPARMSGNQGDLERLRDMNPGPAFAGEVAGGVGGALATGGGFSLASKLLQSGRAAKLAANPLTADVAYGSVYGATQDDNPYRGAALGAGGAVAGNVIGSQIGKNFPRMFNRRGVNAADDAVPTIEELKQQAAAEYLAAETAGEAAGPDNTQALFDSSSGILAREGRITPEGRLIDTDTPITRAQTLMQDFAGKDMSPTQAGSVRKVMGEGLMSQEPEQRRLAGMLVDNFDQWAEPVLPGVDKARETASRYLQGQQISKARELADANSQWYTQSGEENALRRSFRDLDRSTIRGKTRFDDKLTGAIENVSRGNPVANAARSIGKYAPTSPLAMAAGGGALGSMAGSLLGAGAGAAVGAGVAGAGALSRRLATSMTRRNAEIAELMARGGPQYAEDLEGAITLARRRGGNVGTGLFGVPVSVYSRE